MSVYKCAQCGHENDATRVFCQNCGTRLERSEPAPSGPTITPAPVKRSTRPRGSSPLGALGQLAKGILSLAVLGAVMALFIQMGRAPDGVPPETPTNAAAAKALFDGVRNFASSPFRRTLDLTPDQINNYLVSRLEADPSAGTTAGAQFKRAYVVCKDQRFLFVIERTYLGLPVYFQVEYEPVSGPEGASAILRGGQIGRLPVHPSLAAVMQTRIIDPAVGALSDATELLRKANQVVVQPDGVRLTWAGQAPAR